MVEPKRESLEETLERVKAEIGDTERKLGEIKESFAEKMRAHFVLSVWKNVDQEKISDFVKRPFFTEPVKNSQGQYVEGECRLIIHEFLPMQVGWLEYQKDGWNVYRVNKYVDWLAEIPEALKEELGVYEPSLKFSYDLEKALLQLEAGTAQDLKKKFGAFISSQVGQNSFAIKSTQRFNFLLEALKSGIKPFREKPVDKKDLFDSPRAGIELREHQEDAWSTFLKYSRIGVFWPPGAGKTAFGKFTVGAVRGKKLIIVRSVALKEHWEKELRGIAGLTKDEYEVITFAAATSERIRRTEYTLVIVDEVHHWPANTYSELAFNIKTKYLIGLSATPWREDGRAELIFALCGYPVGRDWTYFWKKGLVKKPTAKVYVVRDFNAKVVELEGLLRSHVTTLIYCVSAD